MHYEIVSDNDPINPRDDDNLGTIVYLSSSYSLGDKRVSRDQLNAIMNDEDNIYLPVYAYIHSGVSLNTTGFSCPWDSGQSGCIYVSKEVARKHFGVSRITKKLREKIINYLKLEVEYFNKWMNDDVYGYVVYDDSGSQIDCCFNFFDKKEAEVEAQRAIVWFKNQNKN